MLVQNLEHRHLILLGFHSGLYFGLIHQCKPKRGRLRLKRRWKDRGCANRHLGLGLSGFVYWHIILNWDFVQGATTTCQAYHEIGRSRYLMEYNHVEVTRCC